MAGIEGYNYSPLEDSESQIRLLHIEPTTESSDLVFTLATFYADDAPKYAAISYTWGDPILSDDNTIVLDGLRCRIRENARYALSQVVPRALNLNIEYLWMDAICIDQQNAAEKGHQVQSLADTFGGACHVFACVGPEANNSGFFLEQVPGYASFKAPWELLSAELRDAAKHFGRRPYWSRLWIVQELFSTRLRNTPATILAGDQHCSLIWACQFVASLSDHTIGRAMRTTLMYCTRRFQGVLGRSPAWVILRFADAQCLDARDHVYALLPLIKWPSTLKPLRPDYNISPIELALALIPYLEAPEDEEDMSPVRTRLVPPIQASKVLALFGTETRSYSKTMPMPPTINLSTVSSVPTDPVALGACDLNLYLLDANARCTESARLRIDHLPPHYRHLPKLWAFSGEQINANKPDDRLGPTAVHPVGIACQSAQAGDGIIQICNVFGSFCLVVRAHGESHAVTRSIIGGAWLAPGTQLEKRDQYTYGIDLVVMLKKYMDAAFSPNMCNDQLPSLDWFSNSSAFLGSQAIVWYESVFRDVHLEIPVQSTYQAIRPLR